MNTAIMDILIMDYEYRCYCRLLLMLFERNIKAKNKYEFLLPHMYLLYVYDQY